MGGGGEFIKLHEETVFTVICHTHSTSPIPWWQPFDDIIDDDDDDDD